MISKQEQCNMPEGTVNPEINRKLNPFEAAKNVVEKFRSTITDRKNLALITAGTGLVLLSACGTYTQTTTDSRQATVMEVEPINISGLQSEQVDFVQKEKDKLVDVLREFVSDDILNHYNAVNLITDPSSIKTQKDYSDRYGTATDWEGILYPKDKENTLLGLGGNKNNSFGSGENIPFELSFDNKGSITIALRPSASLRSTLADRQGKLVAAGDPNTVYYREFIPELQRLANYDVYEESGHYRKGRIPLTGREIAAKRVLKMPEDAKFEPASKDDPFSTLRWHYNLNGREVFGVMDTDSSIRVTVSPPKNL